MNDFQGLLSSDFVFKPQGKDAPMAPPRSSPNTNAAANSPAFDFDIDIGGLKNSSFPKSSSSFSSSAAFLDDHDTLFRQSNSASPHRKPNDFGNLGVYDDIFGGNSRSSKSSSVNLDSIFSGGSGETEPRFSSLPVFDKPVYDDDMFDGVSGPKTPISAKYEDKISSSSSSSHPPPHSSAREHDAFDELLGGLGRKQSELKGSRGSGSHMSEKLTSGFDDLLPGFGPVGDRSKSDESWGTQSTADGTSKDSSGVDNPFGGVQNCNLPSVSSPSGVSSGPLDQIAKLNSSSGKRDESFSSTRGVFDDLDPLGGLKKSAQMSNKEKTGSPVRTGLRDTGGQNSVTAEDVYKSSFVKSPGRSSEKRMPTEDYQESPGNIFDMPSAPVRSHRSFPDSSSPSYTDSRGEKTSHKNTSYMYEENLGSSNEVWLSVFEVPLFTQPTSAPPPSKPPPPRPPRSKMRAGSSAPPYAKKKADEPPSFPSSAQFPQSATVAGKSSLSSPIDELENFSKGSSSTNVDGSQSTEDLDTNSIAAASVAAMKEAMDRAEARFRHAKGVREREYSKKMQQEREDRTTEDYEEKEYKATLEKLERERQQREDEERKRREEEERKRREEEEKMRIQREREREEREKEQRRIERERARQAVERATREARERAAAEARIRAEKAAVEKAQAEARERAERTAVLRAQAEARERAARAAAEAKQRTDREKAERESREKAEKEAKEKEARDKAAKMSQQRNENDIDSFFGGGSRASSAPRPRANSSEPSQYQSKQSESVKSPGGSASSMRKASSSTSIVDELSSIFGAAPSPGVLQEVEGESEERRRARLERNQRTQERAAKALAEKNQRDLNAQREQAERHRIAETLDVEIKRWSAGKEGNLRALLSTLQYVLWPECGWQPVSLTDLITAASVKKVYRKATLCIHPDKVQQKGATLQQKYIAEKVFDLLKEAWNKLNSEELF